MVNELFYMTLVDITMVNGFSVPIGAAACGGSTSPLSLEAFAGADRKEIAPIDGQLHAKVLVQRTTDGRCPEERGIRQRLYARMVGPLQDASQDLEHHQIRNRLAESDKVP